jgi:hypothetical protein
MLSDCPAKMPPHKDTDDDKREKERRDREELRQMKFRTEQPTLRCASSPTTALPTSEKLAERHALPRKLRLLPIVK